MLRTFFFYYRYLYFRIRMGQSIFSPGAWERVLSPRLPAIEMGHLKREHKKINKSLRKRKRIALLHVTRPTAQMQQNTIYINNEIQQLKELFKQKMEHSHLFKIRWHWWAFHETISRWFSPTNIMFTDNSFVTDYFPGLWLVKFSQRCLNCRWTWY